MGSDCLMGVGFPFEVVKMPWSWMQAVAAQCGGRTKCR